MTSKERAEKISEEQLATWPTQAPFGILRTAIRDDLMIPAIQRAIDEAVAEAVKVERESLRIGDEIHAFIRDRSTK